MKNISIGIGPKRPSWSGSAVTVGRIKDLCNVLNFVFLLDAYVLSIFNLFLELFLRCFNCAYCNGKTYRFHNQVFGCFLSTYISQSSI